MATPRLVTVVAVLACISAAFAIACDGGYGGSSDDGTTSTTEPATATAPAETGEPAAAATAGGQNEQGEGAIFWRTTDNFASLQANQPYKVLFRVTSGYRDDAISITARCLTCPTSAERQPIESTATRAEPQGAEAPGAYFPFSLQLPFAGTWEATVVAGDDQATITIEAQPSGGAAG